jgi:hypothetical protein
MNPALRPGLLLAALLLAGCAAEPQIDPNKTSYFVDVEYTIGTDGKSSHAKVIKTDAPKQLQQEAIHEVNRYRTEPGVQPTKARRTIEFAVEPAPAEAAR